MALLDSVAASAASVGATLVVCLVGALWARWRAVEPQFWRTVSRLNADVLMPALCFHTMVKAVSPRDMAELWVVPLASTAHTLVGVALGASLGRLLLRPEQRSELTLLAILATSFPNGFAIPLPLVIVLCRAVPWLGGGGDECAERATGVLIIWLVSMLLVLWSLGYLIVHRAMARRRSRSVSKDPLDTDAEGSRSVSKDPLEAKSEGADEVPGAEPRGAEEPVELWWCSGVHVRAVSAAHRQCQQSAVALRQMLNPVLVCSLVGLAIAMVDPLRNWLNGSLVMTVLGVPAAACLPVTLLCLGGQMIAARGPVDKMQQARGAGVGHGTLAALAALRLVVLNVVWAALVLGATRLGVVPGEDRLVQLCLLLMGAMPTAANVVLLCSVLDAFPAEISRLVFVMQLACVPCIAVSLTVYLELVKP